MGLEKRIEVLEKKVAELEGQVQEQPISFSINTKESFNADEFVKNLEQRLLLMKTQQFGQ